MISYIQWKGWNKTWFGRLTCDADVGFGFICDNDGDGSWLTAPL